MRKRFQIFRRGTHIASDGTKRTYTDADLKRMQKAYDPTKMTSPLVFGHPKDDIPAHGALVAVEYDEASGKLFGNFDHVDPKVGQQIDDRAWLSGSLAIYTEDNPNNPVPGALYPKHFGLLGSTPPAVKGMDNLLAHAEGDGALLLEFSEEEAPGWAKGLMENIALLFAEKKPYGDVTYADPEGGKYPINDEEHVRAAWSYINMPKNAEKYSPEKLTEVKNRIKDAAKKFSIQINDSKNHKEASMTEEEKKKAEADAKKKKDAEDKADGGADEAKEKEFAEMKALIADQKIRLDAIDAEKKTVEKAGVLAHVEGLVAKGKVLPTFKAPLTDLLLSLPNSAASLEYGEGEEKKTETPRQFLLTFLEAGAAKFAEGVHAGKAITQESIRKGAELPKGLKVDAQQEEVHNQIVQFMEAEEKAGRKVNYVDAAIHLSMQG